MLFQRANFNCCIHSGQFQSSIHSFDVLTANKSTRGLVLTLFTASKVCTAFRCRVQSIVLVGGVAPVAGREILAKSPPLKSSEAGVDRQRNIAVCYGRAARWNLFNVSCALKAFVLLSI